MVLFSACSVVSKQYYYEPSAAHVAVADKAKGAQTIQNEIGLTDSTGSKIGSVITANGIGVPLWMGPPFVPVVPIGVMNLFSKKNREFEIDITVKPGTGYFTRLAIDSVQYHRLADSLAAIRVMTAATLQHTQCYIIINGSTKVPVQVKEFFMGDGNVYRYRFHASVTFKKVRQLNIVTGNPLLDKQLKNVIYNRKQRLHYLIIGMS
ncbi:hypothetical protein BC343_20835 [Mucilaginibacter pedocola]|uniref:Uncharacterized protein n=2 Tax=Mucilaginibacter pedocola TaxID=1792845 RepID=A0A1S9PKE0_9SPHI|nr:hypothetical protein BC343_20835 [Mucilaginibacter pedocola]